MVGDEAVLKASEGLTLRAVKDHLVRILSSSFAERMFQQL